MHLEPLLASCPLFPFGSYHVVVVVVAAPKSIVSKLKIRGNLHNVAQETDDISWAFLSSASCSDVVVVMVAVSQRHF